MPESISEAIGADHDNFDVYYENIKNAKDDGAKVRWRNQLTWIIARHAISEELTWYPAMEKHLGEEGVRLSKTDKEQHMGVKRYLNELQDMSPADPKFMPLLDTLMDILHHHIEHEKNEDMPRLEGLLSREESEALARQFQRTKNIVPTRSHPSAPTSYVFENLAALMAAPIDRFRDLIMRDFPDEHDKREAREQAQSKL
ncbi:hypothetical protein PMZ80_002618 [Knufia obscura]|uniref:Hemerythrin-like domain-containing protein n=1 Tax=Knufia obscura TaxID=1635080 RepID=A0ABR0RYR5_9EURO|nr:hypothetical protein PMZ80_002618 [Knufia obscura]